MKSGISKSLNSLQRKSLLARMGSEPYDLLVIGGGITGAGVALDAASRGLKVALIEKRDFGSGTSSKSTKLIHGGLRYLKQLEIALVREVGRERTILHRNAPHIVIPENMLLPIVANGSLGKRSTSIGLYAYDMLAGVRRKERRVMLSLQETLQYEPLLRKEILLGGGLYKEYRTDDARLTIEVMKTAAQYGADAMNYVAANNFIYENNVAIGVEATDSISGQQLQIGAKKIVNAAGPWVDELRAKDNSLKGKKLHLTKGVHIVVPFQRLPLQQAVYFDVADKRMVFAIPRGKSTYIGTTDTNYKGEIDHPTTTRADVDYLLKATNYMFPSIHLSIEDVTSSWAGLRPLIHEEGKGPSELSRKDEIFYSPSGVISIAGGKLTGFRKMAERTVDVVVKQLEEEQNRKFRECFTDNIVLSGGGFDYDDAIHSYINRIKIQQQFAALGISTEQVIDLVYKYGTNTTSVLDLLPQTNTQDSLDMRIAAAEVMYGIEHEMVTNLSDFFTRRTGMLYFERNNIEQLFPAVEEKLALMLGWTEAQRDEQEQVFRLEYLQAVSFE
ncbi:MAG: glycerol-3-phosphate dehydrogenase/oxidase [Chitinophagales bacterium]|nr:glycerol-3-phosphate dehydrogenase/oxidase [Chitinophagales bacterium]